MSKWKHCAIFPIALALFYLVLTAFAQASDCPERLVKEGKLRLLEHLHASALAFSHNSKLVATANHRRLSLWETESGKCRWTLHESLEWAKEEIARPCVVFAPSGALLVWSLGDGVLHLVDVKSGKVTRRISEAWFVTKSSSQYLRGYLQGETPYPGEAIRGKRKDERVLVSRVPLQCLAISPDGETIACGANDSSIHVWELKTGKHLKELGASRGVVREKVNAESKVPRNLFLIEGVEAPKKGVAEGESPELVPELWHIDRESFLTSLVFSPDGKTILSHNGHSGAAWDVATNRLLFSTEPCNAISWSPDGKSAAISKSSKGIRVIDQPNELPSRPLVPGDSLPLLWTPDRSTIIAGRLGGIVRAWDAKSGELRATLAERSTTGFPTAMAIARNGRYLAACWNDAWRVDLIDLSRVLEH